MAGVLLTGFEPFDGETVNPSWEVVKQLDGTMIAGQPVIARQLPCVFGEALSVLYAAIEDLQPRLVIAVGQAGGRVDISVERVAINVDDARIPDNKGQQPVDDQSDRQRVARSRDPGFGLPNRRHLRLQSRDVWFAT